MLETKKFYQLEVVASLGRGFSSIGKCTAAAKNDNAIDRYQA